jgi:ferredoxin-fold anticodon binding domain-containing protein
MQKSTKPVVAINLFEKYENQVNGSNRYMGITLRNLTRLLKKHEGEDLILVNKFIERRLHKFKLINLKWLSEKGNHQNTKKWMNFCFSA